LDPREPLPLIAPAEITKSNIFFTLATNLESVLVKMQSKKLNRERVDLPQGSSFTCAEINVERFDGHYHFHPEIEITWIIQSKGQRIVGDSISPFSAGDLVLIGSSLPHQYLNWQQGVAIAKVLHFRPGIFGSDFLSAPEMVTIRRLLSAAGRGIVFSAATRLAATERMETISKCDAGMERLMALLDLLKVLADDQGASPLASLAYAHPAKSSQIKRLQRVMNLLEDRWREPLALEEVAKVAALHPQSLSRFMRQHLGLTYQGYLKQLRLRHVANLLLTTERTIADIAFHCGFNNLANFNRLFLASFGRSPSSYRRQP